MQEQILLFFRSISNNILDVVAEFLTMFGEDIFVICIISILLWCVDKKKGFSTLVLLSFSLATACTIKGIVKFPRPFNVIENLDSQRVETAVGYSFPSGHTATASSTYTSISMYFKKRWLSILCAVIILLVCLSRMYLAVHWPLDVFGGLVIGATISFIFADKIYEMVCDEQRLRTFTIVYFLVVGLASLVLAILLSRDLIDSTGYESLMKFCSISYSGVIGYYCETKITDYKIKDSTLMKLLSVVIGAGVFFALKAGLKAIFPKVAIFELVRYSILGFWGFFLFPVLGVKVGLFEAGKA